ncbi:16020_t:CDS:2, partial [Racocetra persica]
QLPQEIFEMIMKYPNTKATILETPRKMTKQKNKQTTEVYILRKYADIEIIDLMEQMNRLTIQDREYYQDPKEEKSQKRIREQNMNEYYK